MDTDHYSVYKKAAPPSFKGRPSNIRGPVPRRQSNIDCWLLAQIFTTTTSMAELVNPPAPSLSPPLSTPSPLRPDDAITLTTGTLAPPPTHSSSSSLPATHTDRLSNNRTASSMGLEPGKPMETPSPQRSSALVQIETVVRPEHANRPSLMSMVWALWGNDDGQWEGLRSSGVLLSEVSLE
ncbi:hypothetical protein Acr_14g0004540 [Actinidia rufa]|uniref:Uncharacterized protein n=1 Tax=Actinidia rufa TaxID=165716 RepID=A0A7J0FQ27_9ERIC|nr:hypothetical protein Acr_14g0004540 [Actinidia rufa]